jgi:DNA-binding MarR family transcriptional regulator
VKRKTAAATRPGDQVSVSAIIDQWRRERPDLDPEPMAVFGALARVYLLTTPHIDRLMATYGLGRGMFDVMAALHRAGPPYRLAPTQLSRSLMLSGAGMTNRLDRLEALRLIRRQPEPSDRRSLQIELTTEGLRLVGKIVPDLIDMERRLLSGLLPVKVKQVAALLEEFADHLARPAGARGRPTTRASATARRRP